MYKDWWDISKRLRRFLITSPCVYGYKWIEECGHWKVLIVKKRDIYIIP